MGDLFPTVCPAAATGGRGLVLTGEAVGLIAGISGNTDDNGRAAIAAEPLSVVDCSDDGGVAQVDSIGGAE